MPFAPLILFRSLAVGLVLLAALLGPAGFQAGSAAALEDSPRAPRGASCPPEQFELLAIDTLLYVENRGLRRLFFDLNGHRFKLVVEEEEVRRSANAFLIPEYGAITIHMGRYVYTDRENCLGVKSQGPPGADADLLIADLLVAGQEIAYAVEGLSALPARFAMEVYPNPFRTRSYAAFEIPKERTAGVDVHVAVYGVAGRSVRLLMTGRFYPGRYVAEWDGKSDAGAEVGAGLYFIRVLAGEATETLPVVYVR